MGTRLMAQPPRNAHHEQPPGQRLLGLCLTTALLLGACAGGPPSSAPAPRAPATAPSAQTPAEGSDLAIHAMGLVGTPYRYGGNTPDSGFDCSGLIGYVYKHRKGVAPPRTVAQLAGFGQPVDAADLRTGDLVIFGPNPPTHAGIYVGGGRFVHAPSSGGTVRLDRLDNRHWARQPTRFRRP